MRSKIKNRLISVTPYLLIIFVAVIILEPQLQSHSFVSGLDYYFHMSRTYETAMQIKTGHFSYFLSLFSWQHNARIINALYGPVGGYFSGLVLLLTKSWYHWEICMSLLALVLSGMTMYHLGRFWQIKPVINFLISVLFMLSSPICDFVFKQTFGGFGAALVPLIVLVASEALIQKDINPVKLALILVLIVEIHLMTFILSMTFLIPCLLLSFVVAKRSRKRLIKHVFEAAGLTVGLSFNVWGAILEVFGSNWHHTIPTFPGSNLGTHNYDTIMNTYPQTALSQTPSIIGLSIAIFIVVAVILWLINIFRLSYVVDIYMLFGLFFVWMSSAWFPWAFMGRHVPMINSLIQFPKRVLPLGLVLIYLLMGIIVTKCIPHHRYWATIVELPCILLLCLVVGSCWQNNANYLRYKDRMYARPAVIDWVNMNWRVDRNPNRLRNSLQSNDPSQFLGIVSKPIPDYLPTSVNYHHSKQYDALDPYDTYNRVYFQHLAFRWHANGRDHGETINLKSRNDCIRTLPFAKYRHTGITLNHRVITPHVDKLGAIQVHLRRGTNRLSIWYQPSRWFKIGIIINLVMWLGIIIDMLYLIYLKWGPKIPL